MHSEMSDSSTGASDLRKSVSTAVKPGKVQTIGDRFGESSLSTENLRSTARSQTETHNRYLDPRYSSTSSQPRSEYSSSSKFSSATNSSKSSISSSSKSSRSSTSDKRPLSFSSCLPNNPKPETSDARYYSQTFLDHLKPEKKPLSCQSKDQDQRYYYQNSTYYR